MHFDGGVCQNLLFSHWYRNTHLSGPLAPEFFPGEDRMTHPGMLVSGQRAEISPVLSSGLPSVISFFLSGQLLSEDVTLALLVFQSPVTFCR
jgi:hypothetical protein